MDLSIFVLDSQGGCVLYIEKISYQEVFDFLYWGHMGKIHLIHGREASPGLVRGKERGPNIGVRVCTLTD
jgi:hypothetical protein